MRMMRIIIIFLILLIIPVTINITAVDTVVQNTPPREVIKDKVLSPGDDIQKAVDALADGGKITFRAGNYDTLESIVLKDRNDLTIEGTGEVWINTKGIDHHVITLIDCRNITISNIKAQHVILEDADNAPITDPADGAVLGILGGSDVNIVNSELVGCGIYGVYAESATKVLLDGCYLHNNSESAVFLRAGTSYMQAKIKDCIITQNADSIVIQGDVILEKEGNNRIEHNSPGDYAKRRAND